MQEILSGKLTKWHEAPKLLLGDSAMRFAMTMLFAGLALSNAPAWAVTPPGPMLPDVYSYTRFGMGTADELRTSHDVGTLSYDGGYFCGGICEATTYLGGSPGVNIYADEKPDIYVSGGYSFAELAYYVRYDNPTSGAILAQLHAGDIVSIVGGSAGQAWLAFGTSNGNAFGGIDVHQVNDFVCVGYRCDGPFDANVQLVSSLGTYNVLMDPGVTYVVHMIAKIDSAGDGLQNYVAVDPTFTTDARGGSFSFSAGVIGAAAAVPEPANWVLMLAGFGVIGGLLRRRSPMRSVLRH